MVFINAPASTSLLQPPRIPFQTHRRYRLILHTHMIGERALSLRAVPAAHEQGHGAVADPSMETT